MSRPSNKTRVASVEVQTRGDAPNGTFSQPMNISCVGLAATATASR
jgi:hypothetical protein